MKRDYYTKEKKLKYKTSKKLRELSTTKEPPKTKTNKLHRGENIV